MLRSWWLQPSSLCIEDGGAWHLEIMLPELAEDLIQANKWPPMAPERTQASQALSQPSGRCTARLQWPVEEACLILSQHIEHWTPKTDGSICAGILGPIVGKGPMADGTVAHIPAVSLDSILHAHQQPPTRGEEPLRGRCTPCKADVEKLYGLRKALLRLQMHCPSFVKRSMRSADFIHPKEAEQLLGFTMEVSKTQPKVKVPRIIAALRLVSQRLRSSFQHFAFFNGIRRETLRNPARVIAP
mmetsp:Transcript_19441/g.48581  ORF Transcript_19441/g.48581 Transcript_19441/m.48581 type:complete len:243 (+) Transcript_19441:765-1493(+)